MPIAAPVGAAIVGGTAALLGSKMNADANKDATAISADANAKALASAEEEQQYNRGQQSQYLQRLQPYSDASRSSLTRLDSLLQPDQIGMSGHYDRPMMSAPQQTQQPDAAPRESILLQNTVPSGGGFTGVQKQLARMVKSRQLNTANPLFVTMQFPDGSKRLIPPESIAAAKQRGAVAVANA